MTALWLPLILLLAPQPLAGPVAAEPTTLKITVDSARHQVLIVAGPFDLVRAARMEGVGHPMDHSAGSRMMRFGWPVNGYLHGAEIQLVDAQGRPLPREVLHHLVMYNFDRRQLVHESVERLFGFGQDTKPIVLPAGVAAPLRLGEHLGFLIVWHNDTGQEIQGAYVRMTIPYLPPRDVKVPVLPFYVDVHNVNGSDNMFDLPGGRSERSYEFTLPVGGRLIMAGGHMHDYGVSVRLVDVASGKVLVKLTTVRDSANMVLSTNRFIFGFNDDALALAAHHPYRIVAEYRNTSGHAIPSGGMAHINGVIQPSDVAAWPKVDVNDPETKKDLATLPPDLGAEADEHAGMRMDMLLSAPMPMPMPAPAGRDTSTRPRRE